MVCHEDRFSDVIGPPGEALVEKLSDYSTHRIYTQEPKSTVDFNATIGTGDASDLVASNEERCGLGAASRERGVASKGTETLLQRRRS